MALQSPSASYVAGFKKWLQLGRHVRKGEKGIAILAQIICKTKAAKNQRESSDESSVNSPQRRPVSLKTAFVFDLEQTDGEDLPVFATVQGDPREESQDLMRNCLPIGSNKLPSRYPNDGEIH
jgi:antirestriction protein ArdC